MLDEMAHLRSSPHLGELLCHYANLGEADRQIWQNRLMQLEGVEPSGLVRLHGELIAFGWVEQNTGQVPICYRITLAGLRAMRQAQGLEIGEEIPEAPEKAVPRFPRKKKEKLEPVAMAAGLTEMHKAEKSQDEEDTLEEPVEKAKQAA